MSKGIRFKDEFRRDAMDRLSSVDVRLARWLSALGLARSRYYTWQAQFSKPPQVRAKVVDQAAETWRLKQILGLSRFTLVWIRSPPQHDPGPGLVR